MRSARDTAALHDDPKDRLLAMLEQQRFLVAQLRELAARQSGLVKRGDAEGLLTLLGQRQELLDRVMEAQQEIGPLAAKIDRNSLDDSQHERATTLMAEIKDGLAEVMKQDDVDRAAIEAARDGARSELAAVGQAKQARQAYRTRDSIDARFADRKG